MAGFSSRLLPIIDDFAADHRTKCFDFPDLVFRTGSEVLGDYDEVGELAWLNRSFFFFLETEVGAVPGPHFERFHASDALLGIEDMAVHHLASDGNPHAEKWMVWISGFTRIEADHVIGTSADHDASVKQRPQRLKVFHPFRTENVFYSRAIEIEPEGLDIIDD